MISRRLIRPARARSGRRRLRLEQLEARYVLNGEAVLADDAFNLHENGPQIALDVLANDVFGTSTRASS